MRSGRVMVAVVAVVVLAAGCSRSSGSVGSSVPPGGSLPVPAGSSSTVPVGGDGLVGPSGLVGGVPVGWPRSEAGARSAAVAYVAALGTLFQLGMVGQRDAIRAISTVGFGNELASLTFTRFDGLLAISGREGRTRDRVVVVDQPVTATVTVSDVPAGSVSVAVWAVLVVGAVADAPAYSWWHTTTVGLVWERGDWRIAGWVFGEGPSPAANPKEIGRAHV